MQRQRPRAFIAIVAALAVGGATMTAGRASAAIFDIDDRIGVAPGDDWLRAVGVASETPTSNYGTVFLIGACHALSARHVVHRAEVIGQRLHLQFEPWRAATPANSSSGTVVAAGGAASGASDLSQDWILLRLDRCLGETLGFFTPSNRPLRLGVAQGGAGQSGIAPGVQAVGFPNDRTIERDRHAAPKRNWPHPKSWIEGSSSSR